MKFIRLQERHDWRGKAEEAGFRFHTIGGAPYWSEDAAFAFTLEQIEEDIEAASEQLHSMCREAVSEIVSSEELMTRLGIPETGMDLVAGSWRAGEPELYGRFDLAYDGCGPAKMLEYNADTPTSLFESAIFQWGWLEDKIADGGLPEGADQFNLIHEALTGRFREIFAPGENLHFAAIGGSEEDYGTVETLAWMAKEAGLFAHFTEVEKIGLTEEGQFADDQGRVIGALFKLYPWEDMLREEYGAKIARSGCRFIEPAWKSVLSNKGVLPVLWRMFEGHRNLLPAFFADVRDGDPVFERARPLLESRGRVLKPIFSREGASVRIETPSLSVASTNREYDEFPMVVQAYHPLPSFNGSTAVIGSWMAGGRSCGIGIREDDGLITQDTSRFRPHFIWPKGESF